jgi:hypothetical protein
MAQRNQQHATYVKSQYGLIPTRQISTNLGISIGAVRKLAHRLGVSRKDTPRTETAKSKMKQNSAPTEKLSKLSNSENPAKFRILNPYDPTAPVRYEQRIDPNNNRPMLVERRL